jgi:protein dithiol:quinone oxidoreductase
MRGLSWRGGMLAIAVACFASIGAALVAQHAFDMQPCPWCILQRLIYLLIALAAIVASLVERRKTRVALGSLVLGLAACGVASAAWQHVVAAKQFSCNLTLADQIITMLKLESVVPPLFQVTASCAEAAVSLLGLPFEYWSLVLFALIAVAAAMLTWPAKARRAAPSR